MPWNPADNRGGQPEPGWYLVRLVKRGPWLPARIIQGEDGLWSAVVDGEAVGEPAADPNTHQPLMRVWHGGRRSTEDECAHLAATKAWAALHEPRHPLLHPRNPMDPASLPVVRI